MSVYHVFLTRKEMRGEGLTKARAFIMFFLSTLAFLGDSFFDKKGLLLQ
jgi:hypothetical protein